MSDTAARARTNEDLLTEFYASAQVSGEHDEFDLSPRASEIRAELLRRLAQSAAPVEEVAREIAILAQKSFADAMEDEEPYGVFDFREADVIKILRQHGYSAQGQCVGPKCEIWAIVGMIHKIKGISDGAERQRWYDEIAGILASPSGQAAAPTPWLPIESAPKDGTHILAADFSGRGVGFGGNPQQSFQCVVHYWQWADGTHQDEWGWYPSTAAGESTALTNMTHWRHLEEIAASPTGGAEPPFSNQYEGDWNAAWRETVTQDVIRAVRAQDFDKLDAILRSIIKPSPATSASAWPSDLPANGMGAMNLITNFWTGDLKGLTKEGARIVDSLVAHVAKGMRTELKQWECWGVIEIAVRNPNVASYCEHWEGRTNKAETEAAGLREQLEQAKQQLKVKDVAATAIAVVLRGKCADKEWKGLPEEMRVQTDRVAVLVEAREAAEAQLATAREAGKKLQIVKFVSDGDGDWVAVRKHGFDKLQAALEAG